MATLAATVVPTEPNSSDAESGGAHSAKSRERELPRILLGEDDLEMRRMIASALRRDGFEVIEAKNGVEMLAVLAPKLDDEDAQPIELIVSDLRMPGVTGLEILSGLRSSDWKTPFILITAFGGRQVLNEALREGATAVFDKPFDMTELRTAVLDLLRPVAVGAPDPSGDDPSVDDGPNDLGDGD